MQEAVEIDLAKLRQLIVENTGPGKKFSRRGLSLAATDGRNPDLIRDIMRVDQRKPTIESVSGICKALGVPLSVVVKGVNYTVDSLSEWLAVSSAVAAGVWREQVDWPRDDWFEIEVSVSETPGVHGGVVVEGRSMDKIFPPGTILRYVDMFTFDDALQNGDYVIVERQRGGLFETTCKRAVLRVDGNWELVGESTLPEFQTPIFIGKPLDATNTDFDALADAEVRVKALVIDAYLPLRRRKRRPLN